MASLFPSLLLLCTSAAGLDAGKHELVAHLRLHSLAAFEDEFWNIANPGHENYLRFLSRKEIAEAIGATSQDVEEVRRWFIGLGADPSSVRVSALRHTVSGTFSGDSQSSGKHASLRALSQQKPRAVEFVVRRDHASETNLAAQNRKWSWMELKKTGSGLGYTVNNIKKAYGIPADLQAKNESTLQMVWGPGTFGYSKIQLSLFKASECHLLDMEKVQFDTNNHGESGGDNFGEGNLDTRMISCFGLNAKTLVSNTNTSASTEEGEGFGQALLDFLTSLAGRETLPQVLSMSLGSLAAHSCNLLCSQAVKEGHTQDECHDFLQNQRQVCMFLSEPQVARINTAFQVLGARGVSVFMASGDGGSHFSFDEFNPSSSIGRTLNKISCEYQMPVAPTNSPFVVGVGGESWSDSSSHPVAWSRSGSGFSWQFDQPDHQKATVAKYLQKQGMPPSSSFNANGAAYPDIATISAMGTSQAAPIAAGIFSMLIDHRLNAGLPPLGFVAPRMWQIAQDFPGEAFQDITEGDSNTSCDNGFPATDGWDAVTGWGRPIWSGLVKHFGSDDRFRKIVV